ncbi:sugar phosphate isomerase/epimerase family protein [Roseibaca sp. Y0-43]|uniref:sugar phosphate isomerase/epimerase family protein n=1 Tax=Roseibaca sp. Y0-43 TaxID=2816854 RepID=UPI001D0C0A2F|nr:sugar phosphate isomerase/epimerase family protein [Roseibaca sp. Y0-43]MCC1482291.1 sugar phosphate isomerase/epimerase [Roseibaca sp. Y0-43]
MRDFSADTSALALNTATLGHNLDGYGAGWPLERVIDACAAHGFGSIVFWQREIGTRAVEIGNRVRAAGLDVAGLCRTPYLVGRDRPDTWLEETRASIEMAAALGAPVLTVVSGGTEPGTKGVAETQKILAERLSQVVEHAAACNVRLAVEPLNPMFGGNRTCLMTVQDAVKLCDLIGHDALGIAVDVYHVWWDTALKDACAKAGSRLVGFHLCDWLENTTDMLLDRGMMGDGVADLKAIRRAVEGAGYSGPCEVEIFSRKTWWEMDPETVLRVISERFRSVC